MPRYNQSCMGCEWKAEIVADPFMCPPCPKCGGCTERTWHGEATAIERDEIPGGQIFENGLPEPTRFFSHSEHRKALAERGLEIQAKWAGEHDKYMTNWAAGTVDLEAAAALVSRTSKATRKDWPDYEPVPITVTDIRYEKAEP